ncbi:MAG: hypothetical protein PVH19_10710, partial [Planctomycetia bacterium]
RQQKILRLFLAHQLFTLGEKDRAIEICEIVTKNHPHDLTSHCDLFSFALDAGKPEIMDKTLNKIGQIDPQGPYWNYLNAQRITYPLMDKKTLSHEDHETIETAIDYLRNAELSRPNWGKSALLLSKLYDKIEKPQAAISSLIKAVDAGEREPAALARLVGYYLTENRPLKAQEIMTIIRSDTKYALSPDGLVAMAKMKLQQGDRQGAMQELEKAVDILRKAAENSQDATTYIKLSNMLQRAAIVAKQLQKPELVKSYAKEAETMIIKASEVDPSDYRPWLIQAVYHKAKGENSKVEEMIAQIKKNAPKEELQISLAKCYATLKRPVEAELACEKALKDANEKNGIAIQIAGFYLQSEQDKRSDHAKAEITLRKILDGKLPVNKKNLPWARRQLALLLFPRKSQKDRQEAMRLIDANLEKDPKSLPDLRLKARGLAANGTRKGKREGIKILEELIKRPRPASVDQYQLAKLYWAAGSWNRAGEQMRTLLSTASPDPNWYKFYIRCLIDQKEFSSAQDNLKKLKEIVPNEFVTTNLEARIYAGLNQPDRAIAILKDFLKNPKSVPDNELARLALVARVAESLANRAPQKTKEEQKVHQQYLDLAEKNYRELAKKFSKYEMELASFLGRTGRRDEAIGMAEKSWRRNSPKTISSITIRLLNTGTTPPKQIERVEKILNDAKEHFGDNIDLKLGLAELRSIQKKYGEADKLYEQVLKEDPENLVALNNMAIFYALRKMKLKEALNAINKAIELAGPLPTLLDTRSTVYYALGQYPKALDDIDTAIQDEKSAVRLFHQARIQMAAKDKQGAQKSFNEALKLGLRAEQLQPLERSAYRTLRESLKK